MLKEVFIKYKRFEKYFFKAEKAADMIAYIKFKHQFRTMLAFSFLVLVFGIIMFLVAGFFPPTALLLFLSVLVGFRTGAYTVLNGIIFFVAMVIPTLYPSTPLVLVTPSSIVYTNIQLLIQAQSDKLMILHWILQALGFYFYGMERMVDQIKRMSLDELVESAKIAMFYTFLLSFINLICMRLFYSQFSSLLRKVNTLTDNLSKVNNQLNDQNLKLQGNLEMKDVFIYTFSHELKNALNGLLGNLGLAYDTAKNPQVLQYLTSAKVCGEILKNFIHNILDSGKLENGNLEVSPERKDVMNFMQGVWAICGRIIQNKRLQGFLEIEKNVPRFLDLDEQRVIQIILNLVSNAVKFTEKGYVRLRISWQTISTSTPRLDYLPELETKQIRSNNQAAFVTEEEGENAHAWDIQEFQDFQEGRPSKKESHHLVTERPKKFIAGTQCYQLNSSKWHWNYDEVLSSKLTEGSKGILKIQVMDSGCGMTHEEQGKLFRKFSQVSSVQDQRKVGTGLGLWICKELANRLNGDIKIRSVAGLGSVFELILQTRVAPVREKSRVRRVLSLDSCSSRKFSCELKPKNAMKVLIADDDSFNIDIMKNYLNKFGIKYICAHDGEEAVSLFKKHYQEICFVITDNFMPKKTGTEAALEIVLFLEEMKLPKLPIMCISGDLKVNVGEKGITSVIQKPINFDRLKEELMSVYPQLMQLAANGDK